MTADYTLLSDKNVGWYADTLTVDMDTSASRDVLIDHIRRLACEVRDRRAAMKHADELGIDVNAVARLICPLICETCKGTRNGPCPDDTDGDGDCSWCSRPGRTHPCPDCHGRSQHTLHDRVDDVLAILSNGTISAVEDAIERLTAIVADLAKPGITP